MPGSGLGDSADQARVAPCWYFQVMQTRLMIYGSCVTRDIVRITGNRFKLTDYIARQNLISAFSDPVPVPEDWGITSAFQIRSLESDFLSDAPTRIKEHASETDVLLWDIGSERHGVYATSSGEFISATPTQRSSPGVKQIEKLRWVPFGTDEHLRLFEGAAREFRRVLESTGLFSRTHVVRFDFTDDLIEGGNLNRAKSAAEQNAVHAPYYECLASLGFNLLPSLPNKLCVTTDSHAWGGRTEPLHR